MSTRIDDAIIAQAFVLLEAEDYSGAYELLALSGDNYAARASLIVGDEKDIFKDTVQKLWEHESPGSVAESWEPVIFSVLRQNHKIDDGFLLADALEVKSALGRQLHQVLIGEGSERRQGRQGEALHRTGISSRGTFPLFPQA